jgi:formiminotetrahydrofolate cyclodeaminase
LNHPASGSILDLTLRQLLDRLGSSDPTPGGGAAAALAGALGAALVEMTANLTIGRPKLAAVEDQARAIERRAAELRSRLSALADADAAAFDQVSAAYKLPRDERHAAVQAALITAAEVPLETARIASDVLALAEEAAPLLNPSVISDVMVGALLAHAALNGAMVNVEVNIAAMDDLDAARRFSSELARLTLDHDSHLDRVVEIGRGRFPERKR